MQPQRASPGEDRRHAESMVAALGDLVSDILDLVHAEIQLARSEIHEDAAAISRASGMLAVGAVVSFLGIAFVLSAAMFGLGLLMALWQAALIVGLVVLLIGGTLVWIGYEHLKAIDPIPRRTIDSVREDVEWLHNRR